MRALKPLRIGLVCALLVSGPSARAFLTSPENGTRGLDYEQHLKQRVSPALTFVDEQGQAVKLADYFRGRPVVLAMGYYRCPMLCGIGLNATARALEEFPPESTSRDFNFLFLSIDPTENYLAAAAKKTECLRKLGWQPAIERWHFLTGDGAATAQLADEVGFHYRYDPEAKQYFHPSGLVFLSPQGEITSYLFGIDYPAPAFERALANARIGKPGMVGELLSLLCFSHSPVAGSVGYYVLIALRAGAVLTLFTLIVLVRSKRPSSKRSHSRA